MQKYHRIEGGVGFEFAMRHAGPIKSTAPDFAAAVRALHRKKIDDLKGDSHHLLLTLLCSHSLPM